MRPQTPLASLGPDIGRALLLLALAAACPVARADTWNTVRGNPQRTGNIDGISGPKAPKVLWVYKAQEHYVAALVPGPKSIFAAGVGAFGTGVFHAVSTEPEAQERVLWSKGAAFPRCTACVPRTACPSGNTPCPASSSIWRPARPSGHPVLWVRAASTCAAATRACFAWT
ncbi:MAG: hypothetical protein ABR915_12150 [Thermoguttaceae bacterium]